MPESFFRTLENELMHHQSYRTRVVARQAEFEYIEVFFNRSNFIPPMTTWPR